VYEPITEIIDLKMVLKDMEPWIKDPRFLRVGRALTNFKLRPREVLSNWLICAAANYHNGNDHVTFADHSASNDGLIRDKTTGNYILTEHVFIPETKDRTTKTVEDFIIEAVEHKARKGVPYAQGKNLVIFSEAIGVWVPNRVGRKIAGKHNFDCVWSVSLAKTLQIEYVYNVVKFYEYHSPIWKVTINLDFTGWQVCRIQ